MCGYIFNPFYKKETRTEKPALLDLLFNRDIRDFHRSLSGYEATPLISLKKLAEKSGVGEILVKDESKRFNVNAFKPLGASYAIFKLIKKEWMKKMDTEFKIEYLFNKDMMNKLGKFVFSAATDGNHGRAVAWIANRIGQQANIFMPSDTKKARIENIEKEGATVILIDGTYDDCVREVSLRSKKNRWYEVGDTAYGNYTEIPTWVAAGYSTIFNEIDDLFEKNVFDIPDIVFLQAGVGAFAAAGAGYFSIKHRGKKIKLICVEPVEAAGFFDSIEYGNGEIIEAKGRMETIMAGLNCGIPSTIAWPVLKENIDVFLKISDKYAEEAMREYGAEGMISGESGASGLAGFLSILKSEKLVTVREKLGISKSTKIFVVNTEGDTDPESYQKIVG